MLTLGSLTLRVRLVIGILAVTAIAHTNSGQVEEKAQQCSALSAPGHYPDYQGMPSYSVIRIERNASNPSVISLRNLSLALEGPFRGGPRNKISVCGVPDA
jgi:hypothetical protein